MKKERALLINIYYSNLEEATAVNDLKELELLADTAGCQIVKSINILLKNIHAGTFLSKGKLESIKEKIQDLDINIVIINSELKPVQVRNLVDHYKIKVIGRTELIFDIFAQRAKTREAKIQVELAQFKYLLPRLAGYGIMMSRLGGGIGTRGPGEKMIEYDRRHILRRIHTLQKKLKDIEKHHHIIAGHRKFKVASLVGYTNAGKSTLLNSLTQENLKVEDRLFVTLDSTIRKVYLKDQKYILISDTVGFIKDLPHDIVASFRATLSEIRNSDLILHIVDVSDINYEEKIETVNNVLIDVNVDLHNCMIIFNKVDQLPGKFRKNIENKYQNSIFISGKKRINLEQLKEYILLRTGI
ncbi:MAG: GTPase HflX [Spirochaetes bacterium]|nr:GTPase HflX [Spirochaetota bacterium]